MVVKIVFPGGRRFTGRSGKNSHLAAAAGALMSMASIALLLLGTWRLTADVGWTGEFFVQTGIWSHWQVWLALGTISSGAAIRLWRYAHPAASHESEIEPMLAATSAVPAVREKAVGR
jgi:hypothetical protein